MDEEPDYTPDYVAVKGHRIDNLSVKCIHCGAYAIDLYEDAAYGPVRDCTALMGSMEKGAPP